MYIVVLRSLSTGLKAAQAWEQDNNIVVLEHDYLLSTAEMLEGLGHSLVRSQEPDMDDAITAICVEPAARKRLSGLKLAS